MKYTKIYIKLFLFTFIPYFLSTFIIFIFKTIKSYNILKKTEVGKDNLNYYLIMDIYNPQLKYLYPFDNNIISILKTSQKLFLINFDKYGNIVSAKSTNNLDLISLNSQEIYCQILFKPNNETNNQINNEIILSTLDSNLNELKSIKINFEPNIDYNFLNLYKNKLALILKKEMQNYLVFIDISNNRFQKSKELSINQDLQITNNINDQVVGLTINSNITKLILIDTITLDQYIIKQDVNPISYCSNDKYLFFLVKNLIDQYYLLKISKNNKKVVSSYLIENMNPINTNYKILSFHSKIIISLFSMNNSYIILTDEDKVEKVLNLNISDYQIFSNKLGFFITLTKDNFPLIARFNPHSKLSNTDYFSISQQEKCPLFLVRKENLFSTERTILFKPSENIKIHQISTNLDLKQEDIFLKFYGTF